jgi:hypothetical protein
MAALFAFCGKHGFYLGFREVVRQYLGHFPMTHPSVLPNWTVTAVPVVVHNPLPQKLKAKFFEFTGHCFGPIPVKTKATTTN